MKIQCISFGSYSNNMSITPDIAGSNREFLYYPKKNEEHNYKPLILKILGSFAAIAVGVTLYNLRKNKVPLSVVDIEDKSKGLNSINFRRTAIELKKKILYPIKTETTNKKGTFNTGLILSDTKDKPLKEVLSSFKVIDWTIPIYERFPSFMTAISPMPAFISSLLTLKFDFCLTTLSRIISNSLET